MKIVLYPFGEKSLKIDEVLLVYQEVYDVPSDKMWTIPELVSE